MMSAVAPPFAIKRAGLLAPRASTPTPIVLGAPEAQLFGVLHPPAGSVARPCGIVLCNPFGYEAMCVHRTYLELAMRLAAAGFAVLRFDYQGTGDSSGDAEDPARVRAWLDSIGTAIDTLRERAAVSAIGLFGVRLGATLAAAAAAERGGVGSLVAWAPIVSGRAYMRELRAFRKLQGLADGVSAGDGGEEVAGYRLAPATIAELSRIDLLAATAPPAPKVLIAPRDDLPGSEERLARHLTACGADAEHRAIAGYSSMMRDPQASVVPTEALDAIVAWLSETHPPTGARAAATQAAAPVEPVLLTRAPESSEPVRERSVVFGERERLFGIVAEPPPAHVDRARPAVLFLNVGANHRVGPNRMYVTMARALAARGFCAFRFDVAGIGDSRIAEGAPENRLYSKDSLTDVMTAMSFIERTRGIERFVLVGLCSGAYLAFHTSVEDARVIGQVLLNPQTFEWKEGDSLEISMRKSFKSTDFYKDAVFRGDVWANVLRGKVNVRGVAGILGARLAKRVRYEAAAMVARLRGEPRPATDIERAFRAVDARGTESLLVFSANDGGRDMIEAHLGTDAKRMRGRKTFRIEIAEGADHTFTPIASQRALFDLLVGYVSEKFA